jgi:hypothetical protein
LWASSDPGVVSVLGGSLAVSTALIVANAPGQTIVIATFRGVRATATVVVKS